MTPTVSKHPGGRPRVAARSIDVKRLREGGGSWRQIARVLGIGTATAIRLYNAAPAGKGPYQNYAEGRPR
jgi:DNA invertase Pin-like site-specific DNA recombinase